MERKQPVPQEIYRHFKDKLYQVIAVAKHSETGEQLVIYQALYGTYGIYARPLEMFLSEVDHKKYPDVSQKYRFELVTPKQLEKKSTEETTETNKAEKLTTIDTPKQTPQKTESSTSQEEQPNPDLMEFLDADTMGEKRRILIGMKPRITDRLINDLAASLDVAVEEGDLEVRYKDLLYCVQTKEKFEVERSRR
jgi:hypothetical protein